MGIKEIIVEGQVRNIGGKWWITCHQSCWEDCWKISRLLAKGQGWIES
jgi:hypothetical protein